MLLLTIFFNNVIYTLAINLLMLPPEETENSSPKSCITHLINVVMPENKPIVFFGETSMGLNDLSQHSAIVYDPHYAHYYNYSENSPFATHGRYFIIFEENSSRLKRKLITLLAAPFFSHKHSIRGLFIIGMFGDSTDNIKELFEIMWEHRLTKVAFLLSRKDERNYVYTASPFAKGNQCGYKVDTINRLGRCQSIKSVRLDLLSSNNRNFNGCPITVLLNGKQIERPFITNQDSPDRGGMFVELLKTFADVINATIVYKWRTQSHMSDVRSEVKTKRVDLYVPSFNLILEMEEYLEFTSPIFTGNYVWVLPKSKTTDINLNILNVYSLILPFIVGFLIEILWIIITASDRKNQNWGKMLSNNFILFVALTFQQSQKIVLNSFMKKYAIMLYIFLIFMLTEIIASMLSMALTTKHLIDNIKTQNDLFQSDLQPIGFKPYGSKDLYHSINTQFIDKIIEWPESVQSLLKETIHRGNETSSKRKLAAYVPEVVVKSYPRINDQLHVFPSQNKLLILYARIAVRKGFHAYNILLRFCDLVTNTGLYDKWLANQISTNPYNLKDMNPVMVDHLWHFTFIYLGCILSAFIVLIIECLWSNKK